MITYQRGTEPREREDEGKRVTGRDERAGEGEEGRSNIEVTNTPVIAARTSLRKEEELRGMYVTRTMMEEYGRDRGCRGCYGSATETHTSRCRDIMEQRMKEALEGRES